MTDIPPGWRERKLETRIAICSCEHTCLQHCTIYDLDGTVSEICCSTGCHCRKFSEARTEPMTMIEPIPKEGKDGPA